MRWRLMGSGDGDPIEQVLPIIVKVSLTEYSFTE